MDALSILEANDAALFNTLVKNGNLVMTNEFVKNFGDNTLHVGSSYNTSSKELQNSITKVWEVLGKKRSKEALFKYYTDNNYKETEEGKKIQKAIAEYINNNTKIERVLGDTIYIPPTITSEPIKLVDADKQYRKNSEKEIGLFERLSGQKINPYTTIDDIRNGLVNIKNPIDYGVYQDYKYALSGEALTNIYNAIFTGMRNNTQGVIRGIYNDSPSDYSININAKDEDNKFIYSKDDIVDIRYNPIQNKMYATIRDQENKNNTTVTIDISNILPIQDKNIMQMIQNTINNKELSIENKQISVSDLLNSLLSTAGNVTGTNNVNN